MRTDSDSSEVWIPGGGRVSGESNANNAPPAPLGPGARAAVSGHTRTVLSVNTDRLTHSALQREKSDHVQQHRDFTTRAMLQGHIQALRE